MIVDVSSLAEDESKQLKQESPSKKSRRKFKVETKGDFVLSKEDLFLILFPHLGEAIEYMVPETEVAMEELEFNAVAGPSRLA